MSDEKNYEVLYKLEKLKNKIYREKYILSYFKFKLLCTITSTLKQGVVVSLAQQ